MAAAPRGGIKRSWRPSWVQPFRRRSVFFQDTVAVTPVIGAILILGVSAMGVGAVMTWGIPNIQDTQSRTEFDGVLTEFHAFEEITTGVVHGGSQGKASKGVLNIPGGYIERTPGQWFVVGWYPINTAGNGAHLDTSFYLTGYDEGEPSTVFIHNAGADLSDVDLRFETVYGTTHVVRLEGTVTSWGSGVPIDLDIYDAAEFKEYPTRVRVTDSDSEQVLFETWLFPMGALEYTRPTSNGVLKVILENGAVVSQRHETSALRSKPLITHENRTDEPGEPYLVAMFLQLLVDNQTYPGVSAGGAGSWPLLFSLKDNTLRANSTEVQRVSLNVTGPRHESWIDYYVAQYGFIRQDGPGAVGNKDGGAVLAAGPTYDSFFFVLMESLIELTMEDRHTSIESRPPPTPSNNNNNNGPCTPGVNGKGCNWGTGFRNLQ